MSTRAQVRFATREDGVSFSEHPEKFHAQFYKQHDGYPEGLGGDLAKTLLNSGSWNGVSLEIDSLDTKHGDLDYTYYIWQHLDKSTWISIFKWSESFCPTCGHPEPDGGEPMYECIFVGEPIDLQDKFRDGKII